MDWAQSENRSERQHPLTKHLHRVAELALGFASVFEAATSHGIWIFDSRTSMRLRGHS